MKTILNCQNQVALDKGYPSWEDFENWIINNNHAANVAVMIRSAMIKAADIYAESLKADTLKYRNALNKIDDIRNSIVGYQSINWSAHIYPLVAALEEAGIKGMGYEKANEMAKTQLQRIADLQKEVEQLKKLHE
jgi:hypothetical protein